MKVVPALLACLLLAGCASGQPDRMGLAKLGAPVTATKDLRVRVGQSVELLMPQGIRLYSVSLRNPQAFATTVSGNGGSLILRALRAEGASSMRLATSYGGYELRLVATRDATPEIVSLADLATPGGSADARINDAASRDRYKLSGPKELLPTDIRDDGAKTYLEWDARQALPAVFAMDRFGREEMVDGYMREDVYTIDRVYDRLVFRIDKQKAEARRRTEKSSR